jgi:hypothetical protein
VKGNGGAYRLIVDNDGAHAAKEVSGLAELHDTGWYPILVQYFETDRDQVMKLKYSGPDTDYNKDYVEGWHLPPPRPPAASATSDTATTSTTTTGETTTTSETASTSGTSGGEEGTTEGGSEGGEGGVTTSETTSTSGTSGGEESTGEGGSEGGEGGEGSDQSGGDGGESDEMDSGETDSDATHATRKQYKTNPDERGNGKTHYLDRCIPCTSYVCVRMLCVCVGAGRWVGWCMYACTDVLVHTQARR